MDKKSMKINVFYGTVYGAAEYAAEQIVEAINSDATHEAEVFADPNLDVFNQADAVIFVTSTTGQGDLPDNIIPFIQSLKDTMPMMNGKAGLVIGLGDSSYGETYCGASSIIHEVLQELAGNIDDLVQIDALETVNADEEAVPAALEWLAKL
jgi:flavodoxin